MERPSLVRILIVDDNQTTIEHVTRLIEFEESFEVIGSVRDGRAGVEQARAAMPDIVLMDINMPGIDGIEACRQIGVASPSSRVLMMSVQHDNAYLKQAMNAGARGFVFKPFSYDELVNAIQKVHAAEATPAELAARAGVLQLEDIGEEEEAAEIIIDRGILVTVQGVKGGVGTSSIAANIALALAKRKDTQVLLLEANLLFGDLDALLNLQPEYRLVEVLERFDPEDRELVRKLATKHDSGMFFIPAPSKPELAELVQLDRMLMFLLVLRDMYDYVVVDLGSKVDLLSQRINQMADRVVVTLTPDIIAIKNAYYILNSPEMRVFSSGKLICVLNKFSDRGESTKEQLESAINHTINWVIPQNPDMKDAANLGRPIMATSPRSRIGRVLSAIADQVPDQERLLAEMQLASKVQTPSVQVSDAELARFDWRPQSRTLVQLGRKGCGRFVPGFIRNRRKKSSPQPAE